MSILLVTGSRSLAQSTAAMRWACGVIDERLLARSVTLVVFGDANGPDQWAWRCVLRHNLKADAERIAWACFTLDGAINGTCHHLARAWADADAQANCGDAKRWPLVRNEHMVKHVAELANFLYPRAECLALIDPQSRTHGTEHTATLAERAGITVRREMRKP